VSWTFEIEPKAKKEIRALGNVGVARITDFLQRLSESENPRTVGHAREMRGLWAGHWRWRIGDYRLIGRIEDSRLIVVVVRAGHRRDIYE
jgi:mRNA interferase RelE/StbE